MEVFDNYMHEWMLGKLSTPAFEDDFTKDCHACNVSANITGTDTPCPADNFDIGFVVLCYARMRDYCQSNACHRVCTTQRVVGPALVLCVWWWWWWGGGGVHPFGGGALSCRAGEFACLRGVLRAGGARRGAIRS